MNCEQADNVRVIPDAGDVEIVGADTIAKLSAETSENRSVAAWDQRIVITRSLQVPLLFVVLDCIAKKLFELGGEFLFVLFEQHIIV